MIKRDTPIKELGLSNRVADALANAGIDTAEKFITAKDMQLIRGIGETSMKEINDIVAKVSTAECFRREANEEEISEFVDTWCHAFSYDQARFMHDLMFNEGKDALRSNLGQVLKTFRFKSGESVIVSDKLVNKMFKRTMIRVAIDLLEYTIDDLTPDDIGRSIVGNIIANKISRLLPEPNNGQV